MDAPLCPSCRDPMTSLRLTGKLHGPVGLDLCFACQGIWFDSFESYQIAPGGIVDLFKLIHEHRDDHRLPLATTLRCPRCQDPLVAGLDVAKSGRFNYHRCLQDHGRFTVFAQFMIEKGFVRQLNPQEIKTLSARIQTVRCTGCGAPVDITTDAACSHCKAPIAILDPDAVEDALTNFHQAEAKRTHRDPQVLAEAILATERVKSQRKQERLGDLERPMIDLIVSGVEIVWNLLRRA